MSKLATRHLLPLAGAAALLIGASLPAHAYKVYISNEKDNSISVIDSEKLEVVATWKVGRRPTRHHDLSKDGKLLYRLRQRRQRASR